MEPSGLRLADSCACDDRLRTIPTDAPREVVVKMVECQAVIGWREGPRPSDKGRGFFDEGYETYGCT